MRHLTVILLALLITACGEKQIKTTLHEELSQSGELLKSYAMGFNKEGEQTFFIGLKGYNEADTLWLTPSKDSLVIIDNKSYYYTDNSLNFFTIERGDSLLFYYPEIDSPFAFNVNDDNGILCEGSYADNVLKTYTERSFDNYGNLVETIVTESFLPDSYDRLTMSEAQKAMKDLEKSKVYKIKNTFTYY